MIQVVISTFNQEVKKISVSGHALSGNYGEDLICAGVSAIMFGALNSFEELTNEAVNLTVFDNEIVIEVINLNPEVELLIKSLMIQLKTIQNSYPENINISQEVLL